MLIFGVSLDLRLFEEDFEVIYKIGDSQYLIVLLVKKLFLSN